MKSRKNKRKFTFFLVILFIAGIALLISSSKLIKVTVDSQTIPTSSTQTNFIDTTTTTKITTLDEIKNNKKKDIILFTASWCGSCGKIAEDLNEIATQYPSMNIYVMDLEAYRDTANALNVPITPTLVLLYNGKTQNYPEITLSDLPTVVSDFDRIGIR